jgi:hypothetical protein
MGFLENLARKTQTPVHPDFDNDNPNEAPSRETIDGLKALIDRLETKLSLHEIEHKLRELQK